MAAIQWKRICCPVDFSEPSRTGMKVAIDLCSRFGAELTLLYVEPRPATVVQTPPPDAEGRLAEYRREAQKLGAERVVLARVPGDPEIAICDYASGHGVDLLVLGTHGRTDREHMITGSVTEAVVRRAETPVLAVHEGWRALH